MHQQPRTIDPPGKPKSSSRSAHVCSVSGRTSNMAAVSHPGANSAHLARIGTVFIWRPKESRPLDWIKTRAVACRGAHSRDEDELSANPGTFRCFAPEARSRYVVRLSRVDRAATDHTARKAAARAIRRGNGFPVLSAGPTPRSPLDQWDFTIEGLIDAEQRWTWQQFSALPHEEITVDIHCVTSWSKLDTHWSGVSIDTLLRDVATDATFVTAFSDGGYTTNLPLADLTGGQAWVADGYDGNPLAADHGGPARLLVPHLYFWKSAKWVRGLA